MTMQPTPNDPLIIPIVPACQPREPYDAPHIVDFGPIHSQTQADGGDAIDASDGSLLL